jgi:hypothetical protein
MIKFAAAAPGVISGIVKGTSQPGESFSPVGAVLGGATGLGLGGGAGGAAGAAAGGKLAAYLNNLAPIRAFNQFFGLKEFAGKANATGVALGKGIAEGLSSTAPENRAAGATAAGAGIQGAADKAEVHSPSRAMMRIGGFMGGGMAIGMHAQVGVVELASARLARAAMMPANDQGWAAPQMASAQPYAAPVAFGGAPAAGSKPEVHVHFHDCQFGAGTSMAEVEAAATRGVLKAFEADGRAA